MPNITAAGLYDENTTGFEFLAYSGQAQGILFSGNTLANQVQIGMRNGNGDFVPLTDGDITEIPRSVIVAAFPKSGLVLNVSGGSPDFWVDNAGAAGGLKPAS